MINRRDFCISILAVPALTSGVGLPTPVRAESTALQSGFPLSDYTPYGYLDNPFHSWNLHRSGVIRSSPGIGFGYYFPAGPGGYFDFGKNEVYEAHLRLGFLIHGRRFWAPEDFQLNQLVAPYHSKNVFTFSFVEQGIKVGCTFLQVEEDALGAIVSVEGAQPGTVSLMAELDCKLGGSAWWGRDGLAGNYEQAHDCIQIRSFAAGPVFTLLHDGVSQHHFLGESDADLESWWKSPSRVSRGLTYHPKPLRGALLLNLDGGAKSEQTIILARGENAALSLQKARASLGRTEGQLVAKHKEDSAFWSSAPRLEGDWPKHWKHGWIYDFETLRMMVRRPLGIYKHPWDAMQMQAPRTVLAETSIDMLALSYGDPETAKEVFFGLFANVPEENVPCSREDGEMNMVAADGSECGTSISWCYPFFCAESIWRRTRDKKWLANLYPLLSRFLHWTLKHRVDAKEFVTGKCSWETGMDASRRFLIQQPTGAELIEFLRIVELQAATAQAAEILIQFAQVLGDISSKPEWRSIQQLYTAKTQSLWQENWFYDFDTRNGQPVTSVGRDLGQVAPVFCGIASNEQKEKMRPALRKFYADSIATRLPADEDWQDGLHWSSLVLPYVESLWSADERELVSEVVHTIAERIYTSMDRHSLANPNSAGDSSMTQKLGWPGISCEVWGAQGAYGGEGYGWGAVLPAHIIRSVVGFRDADKPSELPISPNLPDSFMEPGKSYEVLNLRYIGATLDLSIRVLDSSRVRMEGKWSSPLRTVAVKDAAGTNIELQGNGVTWQFEAANHGQYVVYLSGISES